VSFIADAADFFSATAYSEYNNKQKTGFGNLRALPKAQKRSRECRRRFGERCGAV
jgi:hypothetical protein